MNNRVVKSGLSSKTNHYLSDGTGRDVFISYDSGGFHKNQVLYNGGHFEPGILREHKLAKTSSMPRIEAKYAHYPQDGTGRDSYIIVNEGGLCSSNTLLSRQQSNFLCSLRKYHPIQTQSQGNYKQIRPSTQNFKQRIRNNLDFYDQQDLDYKLSEPKMITKKAPMKTYSNPSAPSISRLQFI